jgi:hypothetical protein
VTASEVPTLYVLEVPVVRWAIQRLTSRPVHPFFLAYLHIRARAIQTGDQSSIQPAWGDFGEAYLSIPGGPPGKPYYRPFLEGEVLDRSRYWMNSNLAGSWAPSSLRQGQEPLNVVRIADRGFALDPGHSARARSHLLHDRALSVLPLAAYLYRDYGFIDTGRAPTKSDLIETFGQDFEFRRGEHSDGDFDTLFEISDQGAPEPFFTVYAASLPEHDA